MFVYNEQNSCKRKESRTKQTTSAQSQTYICTKQTDFRPKQAGASLKTFERGGQGTAAHHLHKTNIRAFLIK